MTNMSNIRQNFVAAVAALAVSSVAVFGTVGPVEAGTTSAQVQLIAGKAAIETPSVLIA